MADETTFAVQTESTNLAMVVETVLGSKTPPATGWFNLEPNSYGTFGSQYKKTARDPITKSLQLQKGMLTDEDSGIAIELDVTKDHIDRFAEAIFRSATKHSGSTGQSLFRPTGVTATGYTVASLGSLTERHLIVGRGFDLDANNGLKMVGAGSTGTEIKTPGLEVETAPPANATVEVAGWRGATGDIELDTDGNLISTIADFTAMGLHEFQWIYLGGEDAANRFATSEYIGAARIAVDGVSAHKLVLDRRSWLVQARAELDLLTVAVNFDSILEAKLAGTAGNAITVAAVADGTPAAKAELDLDAAGNTVHVDTIIRAKTGGTAGNLITVEFVAGAPTAAGVLTEVGTHVKIAFKESATASTVADIEALIATSTLIEVKTAGTGATSLDATDAFDSIALAGGTDASAPSVGEAGSAVTLHYTPGTTTVAQMEAAIESSSTLIQVARPGTAGSILATGDDDFAATLLAGGGDGDDDGDGKNIDIYFTRWWRNVAMDHADFRKPSVCFEVTYPDLDNGSPMYEYLLGNMVNEWAWNIPLTNKATISANFIGTKTLIPTATRKAGAAAALDPVTAEGVSTATDLARLRLDTLDELGISSDFVSMKITAGNSVSPEKQIGHLGAKIMNQGKHTQMFEADVIFTNSEVIHAVRCNKTCTADVLMRNPEFGALLDLQALTLDAAERKLEKDKAVKIGSKGTGFQNSVSGSTASLSMFAYLPPAPDSDC